MIKSLVRSVVLLSLGAGIGIWFAPKDAKAKMQGGLLVVQSKAKEFNKQVSSRWVKDAEKKLGDASKKVDLKKLNRQEFEKWMASVKGAYETVSDQAAKTQKTIAAVNQYFDSAKSEYRKQSEKLVGI